MSDDKRTHLLNLIKALAMLAVGAALIVLVVVETVNAIHVMRGGATTTAHVISATEEDREYDDGNRVAVITVAVYEFVVDGRTFYGKTEVKRNSLSEGDKLTTTYNPKDPSKNRVKGDRGVLGRWFIVLLFGGMFAYILIKTAIGKFSSPRA